MYNTEYTHSSNIKVINGGGLEPFSEEVLLDTGLSLEDGHWNGSLCDWSTLGFASNDESTGQTSIFHHLVTKELRGMVPFRSRVFKMYIVTKTYYSRSS